MREAAAAATLAEKKEKEKGSTLARTPFSLREKGGLFPSSGEGGEKNRS